MLKEEKTKLYSNLVDIGQSKQLNCLFFIQLSVCLNGPSKYSFSELFPDSRQGGLLVHQRCVTIRHGQEVQAKSWEAHHVPYILHGVR